MPTGRLRALSWRPDRFLLSGSGSSRAVCDTPTSVTPTSVSGGVSVPNLELAPASIPMPVGA